MLGDLVGHELLQQVEVHRVAGLGAAGLSGSLQQGQRSCERSTPHPVQPIRPGWALGGPGPWSQTYPLVDELELEVAPATVWVGLGAGLQRVPLILSAAKVLMGRQAGRVGRGAMEADPELCST